MKMLSPFHSTILYVVVCLMPAACGSGTRSVRLEELPEDRSVDLALEWESSLLDRPDESFELVPMSDADPPIALQPSPALFAAPDTARGRLPVGYCGVLPADASADVYSIRGAVDVQPAFVMKNEDRRLTLLEGDRPVLAYNHGMQLQEGVPERYMRSSYVHPVWSPDGTILTDDFPDDHPHHRGLSWMWPRVVVGGKVHNLWALEGVEQVFDRWLLRDAGPACATLGVKNHWELQEDGRNVLDEWVWIRAYRAGSHGRAVDVRITLEARVPLEIAGSQDLDKGYGGFSFRYGPREATAITSSEGIEKEDSNHKRVKWADESGRFGGTTSHSGAAIFLHPSHPDFPAEWTLRHYGFVGAAWPGNRHTTLQPGRPVTLRYRVWLHDGDAEAGRVAEAYDLFVNEPAILASE